jgi:phosphoribosylcarboxyaminoimidazole (NCAIR) mutase
VRFLPLCRLSCAALQAADAVVAIAGADSSLPGAIAGLVDVPVIALPTSQGNSAGLGGLSGLVTAVSSANLGVSSVGIDQPAAAAAMAARMLRMAAARVEKLAAATAAAAAVVAPAAPASSNGVSAVNNVVPTMLDSLSLTPALATK